MGKLTVTLFEARNLVAADTNGKSDPFAQVSVKGAKKKEKTKTVKKTLTPTWNETFVLEVEGSHPESQTLLIEVFDWDRFGKNDSLGSVEYSLSKLEKKVPFEGWLTLTGVPKGEVRIRAIAEDFGTAQQPQQQPQQPQQPQQGQQAPPPQGYYPPPPQGYYPPPQQGYYPPPPQGYYPPPPQGYYPPPQQGQPDQSKDGGPQGQPQQQQPPPQGYYPPPPQGYYPPPPQGYYPPQPLSQQPAPTGEIRAGSDTTHSTPTTTSHSSPTTSHSAPSSPSVKSPKAPKSPKIKAPSKAGLKKFGSKLAKVGSAVGSMASEGIDISFGDGGDDGGDGGDGGE